MQKIPDSFIKEIKDKVSLIKLVKEYTEMKKVGNGIWQGKCPHKSHTDSTPSFTVWEKSNSWACYGCHCGKKGVSNNIGSDAIAFIQWIEDLNFRKAVIFIAEWLNIPLPTDKNQKSFDQNLRLTYKYQKDLDRNIHSLEYLYERGLDDRDIEDWRLGYDSFNNRIVFPLLDRYKNVLGFTKRRLNEKEDKKYINSPSSEIFNKSRYFYGIHNIDDKFDEIRITEGSMDVIMASKYKTKNVVATLGTSFTEEHAKEIYKSGKTPVIIFDGDEAGNKGLRNALHYFEELGVYCKIVMLPKGKDLADVALENKIELEAYIRRKAVTAGFFRIRDIVQEYNSNIYEIKLKLTSKLEESISMAPILERRVLKSFVKDNMNITL